MFRARRGSATMRLSVAQGTLRAEASSAKGKLLRKGYGKEGLACFIALICRHLFSAISKLCRITGLNLNEPTTPPIFKS